MSSSRSTRRSATSPRAALDAGATYVNDVTAFRADPEMAGLVAERGVECCLMHMLGEPRTMQDDPRYDDVVSDVKAFLEERLAFAVAEGVPEERVMLDPGIGFGKTLEHNLELLRRLDEIVALGRPIVVGTSRKSFLGRITGREVGERLPGTIATNVLALERGASVFRVHEVAPVRDALAVAAATVGPMEPDDEPDDEIDEIDDDGLDDDAAEGAETVVTIEIGGLSLYTHLGVSEEERKVGQRTVIDLRLDVGESDATLTDRIEDTVDYAEVCQTVALVSQQTLPHAGAAVRGDRRQGAFRVPGGERLGQGGQAGAADPPPGRGGRGRGVARAV